MTRKPSPAEPHSLVGPYALNALDDDERAAFEAHLDECESCAAELRGYASTAARLGTAAAAPAPVTLRERVLGGIASARQDRPLAPVVALPVWRRMVAPAAAAAVAAALTVVVLGADARPGDDADVVAVLSAPDSERVLLSAANGARASLYWSSDAGAAVLTADGLDPLDGDEVYALWQLDGDARPRPAGLFRPGDDGQSTAVVDPLRSDTASLAVTLEPEGGSTEPTGPVVLAASVDDA